MTTSTPASLRVAIYARVSSDQQAQEQTIESQISALRKRVAEEGHALEDERCFLDNGVSGSTLKRPALERLRDQAYLGGFQKLYVHSPDRLARRYAYQVLLIDELQKAGVTIEFLNRPLGVGPEDNLLLQMQGMFAEYERAKILERSRRGKRHAASRGAVSVLGAAPYGYRYVAKPSGGGVAAYEIDPPAAAIIQRIFEWVGRDRLSLGEAQHRLKDEGIPAPKGSNWWNRSSLWNMLKNPAYQGSAAFGKTLLGPRRPQLRPARGQSKTPRRSGSVYETEATERISIPVPPLVSEDLFAAAQEQLKQRQSHWRDRGGGDHHLLKGLIECQACGYACYGKRNRRVSAQGKIDYVYYRCLGADAYRFGGKQLCKNKSIRADKLEEAVWSDACKLLRDPQLLRKEYERRIAAPENSTAEASLKKQHTAAQRTVNRLIDAFTDNLLERSEFEPRIQQARKRLAELDAKREMARSQSRERTTLRDALAQLDNFTDSVRKRLDQADWNTRREILRLLVEKIVIEPNQARIVYRINFPLFHSLASKDRIMLFCCRRARPR